MLKRIWILLGVLLVTMVGMMACNSANNEAIKASLGQEFTLPAGQTVNIDGENLSIKFDAVTNDSRCPTGVQCVWAGEVKCQLHIMANGSTTEKVITGSGGTDGYSQDSYNQYKLSFKVEPYPSAGSTIAAENYNLVMKITK